MSELQVETINSREQCADAVKRLIESARSQVAIFSQQLEPLLYHQPAVCQKIAQLARNPQHASVRIIAQSTRSVSSQGHCLIDLAQRLPSAIQIRIPQTEELQHFSESWLIVDDHAIVQISDPQRYEGSVIENDRLHVKSQLDFFNHAWENSEQDQNTRRLSL